jgi:hypothetical protein
MPISYWLIAVTVICLLFLAVLSWRVARIWHDEYVASNEGSMNISRRGPARVQLIMQVVVSLVLLGVGLYVILSKQYADADTKWSYGIIGTVIGFWLKGK